MAHTVASALVVMVVLVSALTITNSQSQPPSTSHISLAPSSAPSPAEAEPPQTPPPTPVSSPAPSPASISLPPSLPPTTPSFSDASTFSVAGTLLFGAVVAVFVM